MEWLLLILIANGSPVLASYFFSHRSSKPIDFGLMLKDKQYLFGKTKTWRGLVSSLVLTSLIAMLLGYDLMTGFIVSSLSMLGDLFSSFLKRRLQKVESSQVVLLDQIPESLLPCLWLLKMNYIDLTQVMVIVSSFIIIDIVLSSILYKFGVRKKPY